MSRTSETNDWQEFHTRIVAGEPTAFAELCEVALDYISAFLRSKLPESESELCDTVAIDTLLNYQKSPEKYKPQKSSLQTYLCMDARGDMLNEIDKQSRRNKRIVQLDVEKVALSSVDWNNLQEDEDWLLKHTSLSREELIQQLSNEMSQTDMEIVLSIADGIRDTEHFVGILGIRHLTADQQRRAVKREKDRIKKKLERFGKRRES